MRHRVTLQSESASQDAAGQDVPTWATVATNIPAFVRDVSAQEGRRGLQVDSTTTHLVTMRYRGDLTTQHRFVFDSRNLNIVKILDTEGRKRWLDIECREAVT